MAHKHVANEFFVSHEPDPGRFVTSNQLLFANARDSFLQSLGAYPSPMKSLKSSIDEGSTRGTGFIPGYQGHIPIDKRSPLVQDYESQKRKREPRPDRIDEYTGHTPGYTGCRRHVRT